MTHLNDQLSALVDGELTGAERDRVHAHLAACEECRAEANAMRNLKRALRQLASARPSDELGKRLMAMAGPGGPVLPRKPLAGEPRPRAAFRAYPDRPRRPSPQRPSFSERPRATRPAAHAPGDPWACRTRSRYLMWGALSFVLTAGLGAFAFSLSGGDITQGPKITPQMELFTVEHAILSGDVPIVDLPPGSSQHPSHGPTWAPSVPSMRGMP